MSKLSEALRAKKIYNNYDILLHWGDPKSVAIEYRRAPEGRLGGGATNRTVVWSPRPVPGLTKEGLNVTYRKEFIGNRAATYWLARNWAAEQFGHDYVSSPFGGLIPKHIKARAERYANELQEGAFQ